MVGRPRTAAGGLVLGTTHFAGPGRKKFAAPLLNGVYRASPDISLHKSAIGVTAGGGQKAHFSGRKAHTRGKTRIVYLFILHGDHRGAVIAQRCTADMRSEDAQLAFGRPVLRGVNNIVSGVPDFGCRR